MAETARQKKTIGRVMREFSQGKLTTHGKKVRNSKQAIAIGLSEAGASNKSGGSRIKRSKAHAR